VVSAPGKPSFERLVVNVTVENLGPCKKLLRFEVDPKQVDEAFESVTKDFLRHASLPGFRPGKAPKDMVIKKHEKDIEEEVRRKLMSDSYRQGIKDQKLKVVTNPDVEEIQFSRGQAFTFAATLETAPDFEVPEYRGLPAKREIASVTDEDVQRGIDALRAQQASFEKVEREVQEGDYVVINYTGTSDGKPLTEIAPTARGLTEKKNFWVEVKPDSFIPGFAMQLLGAKVGEKRTANIDFPADFVAQPLAGKKAVYDVEVVEVKRKVLPEVDDKFAQSYGAENVEVLREGVRKDLQNELNFKQKREVRNQIVRSLMEKVNFDLPESLVAAHTRNFVYDIVSRSQQQGASKEIIDKQKDEIYSMANQGAKERVKLGFILSAIANKEGISVPDEALHSRLAVMAHEANVPADKYIKELQKNEGIYQVMEQLLHEKVIDFLQEHAKIEDVPAAKK
jgi:trigger factor